MPEIDAVIALFGCLALLLVGLSMLTSKGSELGVAILTLAWVFVVCTVIAVLTKGCES